MLTNALLNGAVFVNPLIYAELSIMYQTSAQLDRILSVLGIGRAELPWEVAHWQDRLLSNIGGAAAAKLRHCRTFVSVPTHKPQASNC